MRAGMPQTRVDARTMTQAKLGLGTTSPQTKLDRLVIAALPVHPVLLLIMILQQPRLERLVIIALPAHFVHVLITILWGHLVHLDHLEITILPAHLVHLMIPVLPASLVHLAARKAKVDLLKLVVGILLHAK